MKNKKLIQFLISETDFSRRELFQLFTEKKIKVNRKTVSSFTDIIDPTKDQITINNQLVKPQHKFFYFKFNKPKNVLSTLDDPKNRTCLADFLKRHQNKNLFPIGRLDRNTTGLLLFTNDGELANKLLHPKFHFKKTYKVKLDKPILSKTLERLISGVILEDGPMRFDKIIQLEPNFLEVTISEGRNRIIRRAFSSQGYEVTGLKRIEFGPIKLGLLKPGELKPLNFSEIKLLKK